MTEKLRRHEEETTGLMGNSYQRQPHTGWPLKVSVVLNVFLVLAVPLASLWTYRLGLEKGRMVLPELPTHAITRDGFELQLTMLDDEFEVRDPANAKFKGPPRPELDQAWVDILKGINIRVPSDVARQSNFTSIELADGSGDMMATPAVFHHLHCIKSIRHAFSPEQYPDDWHVLQPERPGELSTHLDHCIENIRQAIMCQGDMTLYHYKWHDWTSRPGLSVKSPHICANWEKLQGWAIEKSFSVYGGLLQHPTFGNLDPLHFVGDVNRTQ